MQKSSYFSSHPSYKKWLTTETPKKDIFSKINDEIWQCIDGLNRNANILEIWFGKWDFARYCHEKKIKNYTWIDIDDTFLEENKKKYNHYNFFYDTIESFLDTNKKYDCIFMSHVFEHLDEKQADTTVQLIYKSLNPWWYWINYMPNADSQKACALRYIDITHKKIYNSHSFEQILLANNADFSVIKHYNTLPSISPYVKLLFKIIHPLFLLFTKIYYTWMWLLFPKIYSSEMLSIMKK